ncbi:MAG: pyridoxal phosphate-dependent aminotransferase [Planctomycetes bacterium]|nr:pyridoxal phosphate-dependent aminotransferase [Planctomycetota bacterium]
MKRSRRLNQVQPSLTMAIDGKAKQYRAEGRDIVSLAAGEPDFAPPAAVEQAAIRAVKEQRGRYTAVPGILDLRRAIAAEVQVNTGLEFSADQVVVSSGAKQALFNALYVLCDEGDEVLIPSPYWTSYPEMATALGLVPVICPTGDDFRLDPRILADRISPRTRAIIVNSPANPTGCVLGRDELLALAEVLRPHDIWVISDDIYARLVHSGRTFHNLPMVAPDFVDRTVLVDGMSKTYCMTGWRVGFAAGPRDVIQDMATIQSHSTSCANAIAQWASLEALRAVGPELIAEMVAEYERRAAFLGQALDAIPGLRQRAPDAAFYSFPDVRSYFGQSYRGQVITSTLEMANQLLEQELIAVVPGEAFGARGYLRLSFATSMGELERGAMRLQRFFAEFQSAN